MDTNGKIEFLRGVLIETSDQAELFDRLALEYRTSGDQAKHDLFFAMTYQLGAYHAVHKQTRKHECKAVGVSF